MRAHTKRVCVLTKGTSKMARRDITLAGQLDRRKNWKNPLVDAVSAAFIYRQVFRPEMTIFSPLDDIEWGVAKRAKGAETGQFQAHHGGFMQVTDGDIFDAASRELLEEAGYKAKPEDMIYLATIGPAIYRSELEIRRSGQLVLKISKEEAEPTVGFALPIFVTDMTTKSPRKKTDGEIHPLRYMTGREIIHEFGKKGELPYSQFNYFQMFLPALLYVAGKWTPGARMVHKPGTYKYTL